MKDSKMVSLKAQQLLLHTGMCSVVLCANVMLALVVKGQMLVQHSC